jgi:hypothetical protein
MMRARTTLATALVTATVGLTAAGCGGMGGAASSDLGGAASVAPSDAVGFVALDTNVSSGQWQAVDGLLKKFPSQGDLMTKLQQSFEQHTKLNWATDVQPALGPELDLVALPGTGAGQKPQLVGLTQPGDQAKLGALLKRFDAGAVSTQIGGWTAFSDSQAALDAVQGATAKLADNNTYRAAVAKLSADALVRAYANGTEAQQLLDALGTQAPTSGTTVPFAWASADVLASGDGVRVNGYSRDGSLADIPFNQRPVPPQPYASSLVDEIPSGAILVADFPIAFGQIEAYNAMGATSPFQKLFGPNAATLASELDSILGGETALYVLPGLPIPEITLVTQPSDTVDATVALAEVLKALKQSLGAAKPGGFDLSSIRIVHAVTGGQFVVSTSQQGLADFQSAGPKLSSDPSFKSAQQAASMPAQTTGFLYVNLASALPLLQTIGPFLGLNVPATLQTDAGALRSLIAYGTRSGDEAGATVFLQVH